MWQILLKTLTLWIVFNPLISFLGIWTKEVIKGVNKDLSTKVLTVALFTTADNWKQSTCLSKRIGLNNWIDCQWTSI